MTALFLRAKESRMLSKSFTWKSYVGWHILTYSKKSVAPGRPGGPSICSAHHEQELSMPCLEHPVSIAYIWNWECVNFTGWKMKKKTQNDYLFRDDNNNDLKKEHYSRKYYKFIKAQINKNTLHFQPFHSFKTLSDLWFHMHLTSKWQYKYI